jgi:AcrR family transcriptional regulator
MMSGRSHSERHPASSLRERFRETTVQAILTAAEEVFADAGLHAAHMGDIAARAGVSVGTLYNHFADRESLLGGLAYARFTEMLADLDATLEQTAGRAFRERLEALVVALLAHWEQHRKFVQILLQGETGHYQKTYPTAYVTFREKMSEIYSRIEKVTSQGMREQALRPELADLAPFFLMGMVRSLLIRNLVDDTPAQPLSAEAGRLLQAFLGGVGT